MRQHRIRQGEYLAKIAERVGRINPESILDANRNLRSAGCDPNILEPGAVISIPDLQEKNVATETGKVHRFQLRSPDPQRLKVVLRDSEGRALEGVDVVLRGHTTERTCVSDAGGAVEIPHGLDEEFIDLELPGLGLRWRLAIGHLDPVYRNAEEKKPFWSGIQGRLNNLGFRCGSISGEDDESTARALRTFQRVVLGRKEPDGSPDEETLDAIVKQHGC